MRFDPEKKREQSSKGISLEPAQYGGSAEKEKKKLFIRIVYQNYLIFHLHPIVYNPDTCSQADPHRANVQDRRRCGEWGHSAAD